MIGLALACAALTSGPTAASGVDGVVRVNARPELPWVTVVVALANDGAQRVPSADDARALVALGGAVHVEQLAGRSVVVVEGPPEAHDVVVATAHRAANGAPHVLFVDGRTTLADAGVLPRASRTAPASTPPKKVATQLRLALAPSPALLDVEGAALALLVEDALAALAPVDARVDLTGADAALVVDVSGARDAMRTALEQAVAPLTQKRVDELRNRARGVVAERRARAGGWARDMATMWLAFGTTDVEERGDLGSALRARVFPTVLVP